MILGGKITLEEYEDWKANWPDSTKKDYVPNIINKKHISYDEYLAEIQARNEIAESAKKRYQDINTIEKRLIYSTAMKLVTSLKTPERE